VVGRPTIRETNSSFGEEEFFFSAFGDTASVVGMGQRGQDGREEDSGHE
jgi:hypothetical protein